MTTVGICSYNNLERLKKTIECIVTFSSNDVDEILIVDNNSNEETKGYLNTLKDHPRYRVILNSDNKKYSGAVNQIFKEAKNEMVIYCDNDVEFRYKNWDQVFHSYLARYRNIGMIGPNWGAFSKTIDRGDFIEVDWMLGCMFMCRKMVFNMVGGFDEQLGHQNECDFALRLRMLGFKCAFIKEFGIFHHCNATNSPEQQKNISDGVIQFINKWNAYFLGAKNSDYFSANVMRWDDFPINRVYQLEYFKELKLNENPEQMVYKGVNYDLIKLPMYPCLYRK